MTDVKPLTAEEEWSMRDCLDPLAFPNIARLLATLDAERAARAEAEAKLRDLRTQVSLTITPEDMRDATAKRIAEWLRTSWMDLHYGDEVAVAIERGDWRRV